MSSSTDGGYVHDPSQFDEDGKRRATDDSVDGSTESGGTDEGADRSDDWIRRPVNPIDADRTFDRRGWLLVGVVVVAFVLAPLAILLYPPGGESYLFTLIVVPFVPATLLAVTAVWATTRP